MALRRKQKQGAPSRRAVPARVGGPGIVQLHARRRRSMGVRPGAERADVRRRGGDRRPTDVRRGRAGRGPLGAPAPDAPRPRRPRDGRRRQGARLARRDARSDQGRPRRDPVPEHAARPRPRVPRAALGSAADRRRPRVRGGDRGDAEPDRRHRADPLPRRGSRRARAVPAGRADRGDDRRRDGADPLHLRDDEGPEGRRPHARATPGPSACRRPPGWTRASATSSGARPGPVGRRRSGTSFSAPGRTAPRWYCTRARSTRRSGCR